MDLAQLAYFRTVARIQHVTQAAEELGITQPALSRAIARLERDLGAALFDHRGRTVRLNRYGEAFLRHTERALAALDEGRREIQSLADREAGLIAFGFAHALGTGVVPDLVASFRERFPRARFQLMQNAAHIVLAELLAGQVDLALVSPLPAAQGGIERVVLASEELFLAVPRSHRLAKRRAVSLAVLRDETFVCLREGYALRSLTDHFCAQAGFAPQIAFEGEEIATLRALVAAGLGVAIIPAAPPGDESAPPELRITQPECRRDIGLLWEPGRFAPDLVHRFRRHILTHYGRGEAP